jgi:hypothetical protein
MHAREVHAHEIHTREMHAREVHAHEVHAYEMYACEVHAHEVHAYEVHTNEMHAHEVSGGARPIYPRDNETMCLEDITICLVCASRASRDIAKEWGVLLKPMVTEISYSLAGCPRGANSFAKALRVRLSVASKMKYFAS